ncbi:unnamed protein product [Trifolium pratense]|uniref:Uncharacterized protein n=1 Tax=Trifolium pratense TaxID=57577 RepID=A0ACB0J2Y0_TRIPR|nr:unnamed protein product [Trifolium pratense]
MTSATLFGKLQEHEIELGRLEKHEVQEKKYKSLALKSKARDYDSNDKESQSENGEDDDVEIIVKKLKELLKRDKTKKFDQEKKCNGESTSTQNITCYECGKQGHIKTDCPKRAKKSSSKRRKESKPKRVYIAWDDNEVSSSFDSETEEYAKLALMASHHSDDECEEVSSKSSSYDNDFQEKQKFTCKECDSLSFQIVQLKRVLERYEKGQVGLDNILSQQRHSNDKSGLGYSKFDKPSTNKTIFVKEIDQSTKEKVNKAQKVNHNSKKIFPKKKSYVPRYRMFKVNDYVTYGDNNKGKILGICKVGAPPFTSIEDVLNIKGLKVQSSKYKPTL